MLACRRPSMTTETAGARLDDAHSGRRADRCSESRCSWSPLEAESRLLDRSPGCQSPDHRAAGRRWALHREKIAQIVDRRKALDRALLHGQEDRLAAAMGVPTMRESQPDVSRQGAHIARRPASGLAGLL